MKNIFYFLLVCLISFSACRKEVDDFETIIEEEAPEVFVRTTIKGRVLDEDGAALANIPVQVGNETLSSDANGVFRFESVLVKKSGATVVAKANGYFEGVSRANISATGGSFAEIKLLKKGVPEQIDANQGAGYVNEDGLDISIPPNSVRTLSGGTFSGPVNVYSRWIDPTADNLGGTMPGDLTAKDEDGNPLALISYGMFAFELETEGGEELTIASDTEIEVKMPIPDELLSDAPEEISFWLYDLEEGEWLLSGACPLVDGHYICKVPTTGFWNCDVGVPAICLSGNVFNSDLSNSSYLKVVVEDLTDNFIYWGYTDSLGYFCGSVPQAALLQISLIDHCDNVVYTAEIGPFSSDFQLEDIILDVVVEEFLINITGTVGHCMTTDIVDGHLAVSYPGHLRIFPFEDGGFEVDLGLKCVAFPDMKMKVYSSSQSQSTLETTHNDFADIDLGLQTTCEELTDYFNLTVDGVDYWTAPTQFYLNENETTNWMILEGLSGGGKFILDLREFDGVGTYTTNTFLKTENEVFAPTYPLIDTSSPDIVVEITAAGEEFIEGTLSGMVDDGSGTNVSILGDFKVRKEP